MTEEEYLKLFSERNNEKVIGEASAPYLFTQQAPGLIHQRIPEVKMVAILRNPIDRAYSQFNFLRRLGMEKLSEFGEALEEEDRRYEAGVPQFLLYKRRGLYAEQLERYHEIFSPGQLRVYLHEKFDDDPMSVIKDVFSFLEIDNTFAPDIGKRHNPTLVEQKGAADRLISGLKRRLLSPSSKLDTGNDLMVGLVNSNVSSAANVRLVKPPAMDKDLRKGLALYFESDVAKLSKLLGKDLSHWLR